MVSWWHEWMLAQNLEHNTTPCVHQLVLLAIYMFVFLVAMFCWNVHRFHGFSKSSYDESFILNSTLSKPSLFVACSSAHCFHLAISTVGWTIYCSSMWLFNTHYWKPALCRVSEALPSVFYWALGKDGFAECFFWHSTKMALPSVFFQHSAKMYFAECHFSALGKMRLCRVPFFGTRQRDILPCAFFFALGKLFFQSNFWGPKWIQMKKFSTTKLHNFSRSTKFILVISSFDKAKITLLIKSTSLVSLILVSWK